MKRLFVLLAAAAACSAAGAQTARVIVTFKPDSTTLRAQALAAGDSHERVAQALGARAQALAARHGLPLATGGAVSAQTQVVTASGITSEALAAKLAADPEIAAVEPDRRARAQAVPNDLYYQSGPMPQGPAVGQWYLRAPDSNFLSPINAPAAWNLSKGGAAGQGVIVAVLDTGVRFEHPDLQGKLIDPGIDMIADTTYSGDGDGRDNDASDPGDFVTSAEAATSAFTSQRCTESRSSWHGTQVAGLVGALTDNAVGIAGVGWNARVLPVRVLGKCGGAVSDIAAAIRWAAGLSVPGVRTNTTPARVINLSLGAQGSCGTTYQNAINDAVAHGVTVVVAAGNDDGKAVSAPGNCQNVITVGALRHRGTKVGFANVGPQVTLSAPGGNCINITDGSECLYPIMSTVNDGTNGPGNSSYTDSYSRPAVGTSFAAPIVSGTVALMIAAQPGLSPAGIKTALQGSVRAFPTNVPSDDGSVIPQCQPPSSATQDQCYCTTSTCGAGMLDAGAAVALAQGAVALTISPVITVSDAPTARQTVTVSAAGSTVGGGRGLSVAWTLLDGGGIATTLTPSADGSSVSFVPSGAGTVVVRATLTDSYGYSTNADQSVVVAKAPGSGGGGAASLAWLAGVALAAAALRRRPLGAG